MADERTYIRLHDGMPDHPKIDALSDRAFRLLISTWCWCSRHLTDGRVPGAVWSKRGTAASRAELVAAGLANQSADGSVLMHDYLEHQRSADEVAALRAKRAEAGKKGADSRWGMANAIASAKQVPWQTDGKAMASTDTETDTETDTASNEAVKGRKKRAHAMPEGWEPKPAHTLFAAENGIDVQAEATQFGDYHAAKGNKWADWDRAFSNWLRNSVKWSRPSVEAEEPRIPHVYELEIPPDNLSEAEYSAWMREQAARRKAQR